MSKRPIFAIPQKTKKPRLEISFNTRNLDEPKTKNPPVTNNVDDGDLWGDDDCEIYLASQALDEIEKYSQQIIVNQHDTTGFSFSQMRREVQSSTQVVNQARDPIDDFHLEDDDAFDNIDLVAGTNEQQDPGPTKRSSLTGVVKQLDPVPLEKDKTKISYNNAAYSSRTSSAKDDQLNNIMSRLQKTTKDNEKLSKELSDFNEKLQTKDGEVAMLRIELNHLKKLNETLKFDKIKENEHVKKEWQEKIKELEKLASSQQAELQFQNIHKMNMTHSKLNKFQKLGGAIAMHRLHLGSKRIDEIVIQIPSEIFEKPLNENGKKSAKEIQFCYELTLLQTILSKINNRSSVGGEEKNQMHTEISTALQAFTLELNNYVKSLNYKNFRDTNIEFDFLCNEIKSPEPCKIARHLVKTTVYQQKCLFINEKCPTLRRTLAALALLVHHFAPDVMKLLQQKINNIEILELVISSMDIIGFSAEVQNHFGVFEGFSFILQELEKWNLQNNQERNVLTRFIRTLVLSRPGMRTLFKISECLTFLSSQQNGLLVIDSLCTKNSAKSLVANENHKIIQFSSDACALQIYGVLLETAFPQYTDLNSIECEYLYGILYNHIKFMRNCLKNQLKTTCKSTNNEETCDCYIKIGTSFVILFHLILKQWIDNNSLRVDIRKMSKISKLGALVLCDVFHIGYRREILQGSPIKHRLQLIHDWLTDYQDVFYFKETHLRCLRKVNISHIIVDPLRNVEPNEQNMRTEGNEIWQNLTSDFL